jgi:hypothetical protein
MKPIISNPKNDFRKIHDAIAELTKVVGEIKSILTLLQPESIHQQENMYPWHSTDTSGAYDEES